ncbi:hypothetical protein AB0395_16935 [Streptosporangium sp. NPDC051023]|uniref:hypothetical protein n=1 Tax=Streptosporangium sp. NPDC051023 TaxID=3155410 RepID=UPI00344FA1D0
MNTVPLALNALASIGAAGSSVAGVFRPALGLRPTEEVTTGVHLYTRAYAARAVPLGLVTAFVLIWGPSAALAPLLVVSGVAQVGDSALGFMRGNLGMALGAGAFAVVHLLTAALWS